MKLISQNLIHTYINAYLSKREAIKISTDSKKTFDILPSFTSIMKLRKTGYGLWVCSTYVLT